jgi:hypothetical protein
VICTEACDLDPLNVRLEVESLVVMCRYYNRNLQSVVTRVE